MNLGTVNTITDLGTAQSVLRVLINELGLGFHLDTPMGEYIDRDGKQLFNDDLANEYDRLIEESINVFDAQGLDAYEFVSDIFTNIIIEITAGVAK